MSYQEFKEFLIVSTINLGANPILEKDQPVMFDSKGAVHLFQYWKDNYITSNGIEFLSEFMDKNSDLFEKGEKQAYYISDTYLKKLFSKLNVQFKKKN